MTLSKTKQDTLGVTSITIETKSDNKTDTELERFACPREFKLDPKKGKSTMTQLCKTSALNLIFVSCVTMS